MSGTMRIDGYVRGKIDGTINGVVHGVVKGDVSAFIENKDIELIEENLEEGA